MPVPDTDPASTPVRVWDLPTRLFHWLLALAVLAAIVTAHVGGNWMVWHTKLGLFVLALLLFRVVWGLIGGRWSRFASFVYSPATLLRYLRGQGGDAERLDIGHSPLGALSVFGLLGLLLVQVATGLVADDEISTTGPLNRFVAERTASRASHWHADIGQWILIALIVLHVLAIGWYLRARRNNLLRPMLLGDKPLPAGTPASADGMAQRLLALAVGAACAAVSVWVWRLGG